MKSLLAKKSVSAVVIGGANTDIVGTSEGMLRERVSNPGSVRSSAGGVGRNIAENLARLGVETHLMTAFGSDSHSRELAESCRRAGVLIEHALFVDNLPGGRYVAINDERHDLAVGVSDMRAIDRLGKAAFEAPASFELLMGADVVVVDANLTPEAIAWLAEHVTAPMVGDPVSVAKAERLKPILPRLAAIKPNALESQALLGRPVAGLAQAEQAAEELVALGCGAAFVTPGREGIAWAQGSESGSLRSPGISPVNTSGAGDAFAAGIVFGMLAQAGVLEQARFASALSIMALESEETVNPGITIEAVNHRMKELYG